MSEDKALWSHWRGRLGHVEALKEYFPELLASRDDLRQAVAQVENAERAIDSVMGGLEEEAREAQWDEES